MSFLSMLSSARALVPPEHAPDHVGRCLSAPVQQSPLFLPRQLAHLYAFSLQEHKKLAMDSAGIAPSFVKLVPADIQHDDVHSVLIEKDFKPKYKTLAILEGVLYELAPERLPKVSAHKGPGS